MCSLSVPDQINVLNCCVFYIGFIAETALSVQSVPVFKLLGVYQPISTFTYMLEKPIHGYVYRIYTNVYSIYTDLQMWSAYLITCIIIDAPQPPHQTDTNRKSCKGDSHHQSCLQHWA